MPNFRWLGVRSLVTGVLCTCIVYAAATPAKNTPVKKTTASKKATAVRIRTSVSRGARNSTPVARQSGPTAERYREIQESLISKGYLSAPATGVWDQNSIAAMKKFQEDSKLEASGKVTAKALIGLGLGPKDESAPNMQSTSK